MSEFEKDNNLLDGKGESDVDWITVNGNHIPIKEGETPKEAVENHFKNKESDFGYPQQIEHLIKTLKKIRQVKLKELVNYIRTLEPIKLTINENEIVAKFDKYSADKNVYGIGNSDVNGYNYKLSHIKDLPRYIQNSKYSYSKSEKGKNTRQHKGVKQWHYFNNKLVTDEGTYKITINVRDKGTNQYIYEVAFKKIKT